jgi:tyrosinase
LCRLWQLAHPGVGVPATLLHRALPRFQMTVAQTIASSGLGYDYAAAIVATAGDG